MHDPERLDRLRTQGSAVVMGTIALTLVGAIHAQEDREVLGDWRLVDIGAKVACETPGLRTPCFELRCQDGDLDRHSSDSVAFLFRELTQDATLELRLRRVEPTRHVALGLIFRESLLSGSRYAGAVLDRFREAELTPSFLSRDHTDARSRRGGLRPSYVVDGSQGRFLRTVRIDSRIIALESSNGRDWWEIDRHDFSSPLPTSLLGGVALSSAGGSATALICGLRSVPEDDELPVIDLHLSREEGVTPLHVSLDASASRARAGEIVDYRWNLGDGTVIRGPFAEHTYQVAGSYGIVVTVTDSSGRNVSLRRFVHARATRPVGSWEVIDLEERIGGSAEIVDMCLRLETAGGPFPSGPENGRFAFRRVSGDFAISCRLPRTQYLYHSEGHAGLLVRESVAVGSRFGTVSVLGTPNPGFATAWRSETGEVREGPIVPGGVENLPLPTTDRPAFLGLERVGNELIASGSTDGSTWEVLATRSFVPPLPENLLVGVIASALGDGVYWPTYDNDFCDLDIRQQLAGTREFLRADVDANGSVSVTDALVGLRGLFAGQTISCLDAADADDDGQVNLADPILILNYLFRSLRAPSAPFGACDVDRTRDEIGCQDFDACRA